MGEYTTIVIDGNTIEVKNCSPRKAQKTRKSVIGKTIVETKIIGLAAYQWELSYDCIITSDLSATRATIEALQDGTTKALVDGIHDGTYYVKDVSFNDGEDSAAMIYYYTITLVEE